MDFGKKERKSRRSSSSSSSSSSSDGSELQSQDDMKERMSFLNPELKSLHNRIELLETYSERNSAAIGKMEGSYHGRDFATEKYDWRQDKFSMGEEVWYHALQFLDHFNRSNIPEDVEEAASQFYKLSGEQDETGIMDQHKRVLERTFKGKEVDLKFMYMELIRLLYDWEKKNYPNSGQPDYKDVTKLQGYQDWTNRLQWAMGQRCVNDIEYLKNKVNEQNTTINNLTVMLQSRDETDSSRSKILDEQAQLHNQTLEVLEKRLDENEKHIGFLQRHDEEQDNKIGRVDRGLDDLENKLKGLEAADEFLQEAQKNAMTKAQSIEEDEKKLSSALDNLGEDLKELKQEHEKLETKVEQDVKELKGNDQELEGDHEKLKEEVEKLRKDFDSDSDSDSDTEDKLEELEKNLDQLKERIARLDQTTENNLVIINNITIKQKEAETAIASIEVEKEKLEADIKADIDHLKETDDQQKESWNQVRVDIEEIKGEEQKVNEAIASIQPIVFEVKEKVHDMDIKVEKVKEECQEEILTKVEVCEGKLNNLQKEVEEVKEEVDHTVEKEVDDIKKHIEEIKVDLKEDETERVKELEDKLDKQLEEAEAAKKALADLKDKIDHMKAELGKEFTQDINQCQAQVDSLEPRVISNEKKLDKLNHDLSEQEVQIRSIDDHNMKQDQMLDVIRSEGTIAGQQIADVGSRANNLQDRAEVIEKKLQDDGQRLTDQETKLDEVLDKLGKTDDRTMQNLEKLVNIEEHNANQLAKAHYVEMLNDQMSHIDEAKQQSEAKLKEEIEEISKDNEQKVLKLEALLQDNLKEIEGKVKDHDGEIEVLKNDTNNIKDKIQDLKDDQDKLKNNLSETQADVTGQVTVLNNEIHSVEDKHIKMNTKLDGDFDELEQKLKKVKKECDDNEEDIKALKEKMDDKIEKDVKDAIQDLKKSDLDTLKDQIDDKMHEVDNLSKENTGHVDKLRELNQRLLEQIQEQVQNELDKQAKVTEGMKEANSVAIMDIKEDIVLRFNSLQDMKNEDIEELKLARKRMEDELERIKDDVNVIQGQLKGLEDKQEDAITEIHDTKVYLRDNLIREVKEQVTVVDDNVKAQVSKLEEDMEMLKEQEKKKEDEIKQLDIYLTTVKNEVANGNAGFVQKLEDERQRAGDNILSIRNELEIHNDNFWSLILEIYGALRGYTIVLKSRGPASVHQSTSLGVYRVVDTYEDKPVYRQDVGDHYLYFNPQLHCWMVSGRVGQNHGWIRHSGNNQLELLPADLRTGWKYQPVPRGEPDQEDEAWMADDDTLTVEILRDVDRISETIGSIRAEKEID